MAKAIWNGVVLAESDKYEIVEGNVYFPPESVKKEYFRDSDAEYECPWRGHARHYDIVVEGKIKKYAAWCYPDPKPAAKVIKDHVAFDKRKGVKVEK